MIRQRAGPSRSWCPVRAIRAWSFAGTLSAVRYGVTSRPGSHFWIEATVCVVQKGWPGGGQPNSASCCSEASSTKSDQADWLAWRSQECQFAIRFRRRRDPAPPADRPLAPGSGWASHRITAQDHSGQGVYAAGRPALRRTTPLSRRHRLRAGHRTRHVDPGPPSAPPVSAIVSDYWKSGRAGASWPSGRPDGATR